jgi:hypothetical protein
MIDKKGNDNKQHFDFYVPSEKKIISFEMENKGRQVPIDPINDRVPGHLREEFDFEFDEVESLVEESMRKNEVKAKIEKIMVSLQESPEDNKPYLICTVFLSGLGMANVTISVQNKRVISFEKKSFFNLLRKVK